MSLASRLLTIDLIERPTTKSSIHEVATTNPITPLWITVPHRSTIALFYYSCCHGLQEYRCDNSKNTVGKQNHRARWSFTKVGSSIKQCHEIPIESRLQSHSSQSRYIFYFVFTNATSNTLESHAHFSPFFGVTKNRFGRPRDSRTGGRSILGGNQRAR